MTIEMEKDKNDNYVEKSKKSIFKKVIAAIIIAIITAVGCVYVVKNA